MGEVAGPALVTVDVWSDYASPHCYLELPELMRLRALPGVAVTWHAFEMRPEPVPLPLPDDDGYEREWARTVAPMAAARRHPLQVPRLVPRTRLALEAAEHARAHGLFDAMHVRLFEAYFRHGRDVGLLPVLVDVAVAAGLDGAELRRALDLGRHTGRVLQATRRAQAMGVASVPAMVVAGPAGQQLVAGSQTFDALRRVVEAARGEAPAVARG